MRSNQLLICASNSATNVKASGRGAPVGVAHDAVHEVVVQEAETRDGRLHVEVDGVLARHAPQVLAVAHPGQRRDHLAVPRHLDVEPAAQCATYHMCRIHISTCSATKWMTDLRCVRFTQMSYN